MRRRAGTGEPSETAIGSGDDSARELCSPFSGEPNFVGSFATSGAPEEPLGWLALDSSGVAGKVTGAIASSSTFALTAARDLWRGNGRRADPTICSSLATCSGTNALAASVCSARTTDRDASPVTGAMLSATLISFGSETGPLSETSRPSEMESSSSDVIATPDRSVLVAIAVTAAACNARPTAANFAFASDSACVPTLRTGVGEESRPQRRPPRPATS